MGRENEQVEQRPSWDEYFIMIALKVAERSTCLRRKVGAVIVKDNRILATGYNGAPTNVKHCIDVGCLREKLGIPSGVSHELCRGLHAEQNAIIQAAVYGVSVDGATCYCTTSPCAICMKLLINAGVKRIVAISHYHDEISELLLKESNILFEEMKWTVRDGTNTL